MERPFFFLVTGNHEFLFGLSQKRQRARVNKISEYEARKKSPSPQEDHLVEVRNCDQIAFSMQEKRPIVHTRTYERGKIV